MKCFVFKKEKNKAMSFMLSIAFVAVCFALIYFTYGVYYLTNDDTGIMKCFSGYSTGMPEPYHQFGSYTLGLLYKFLYTLIPTWNWYSYVSILLVILSNATIIYTIYQRRIASDTEAGYLDFAVIAVFVVAVSLFGIAFISWTTTAAFCSVAGLMLLLSLPESGKHRYCQYAFVLVFMVFGLLTRKSSYKAVLPFAVLVLCYRAVSRFLAEGRVHTKQILRELLLLMLPLLLIMAYSKVDGAHRTEVYQPDGETFQHYRVSFIDKPHLPYEGNEEFYESLGWDEELYDAACDWMFIDPRFNTENLKKIAEASESMTVAAIQDGGIWNDFMAPIASYGDRVVMCILVAVFFVIGAVMTIYKIAKGEKWLEWFFLSAVQAFTVAEWLYLLLGYRRFIDRTFYCATIPAVFVGVWLIAGNIKSLHSKTIRYLLTGAVAVITLIVSANQNLDRGFSNYQETLVKISHDADEIYFNNPDNLYIYDCSIISGTPLFLDMSLRGCGRNALMYGGTGVYTKAYYEKTRRFGYEEFYSNNLFDENVFYITTADIENSSFMRYMRKTYGDTTDAELVEKTDHGVCVYKFTR